MITILLFVSTFDTGDYCENLYYTNPIKFVEMRCNEDVVKAEFYNLKR